MPEVDVLIKLKETEQGSDLIKAPLDSAGNFVVEEFDDWFVRTRDRQPIFILRSDSYISLDFDSGIDGWKWPKVKGNRKVEEIWRRTKHTSGFLHLFFQDETGGYQQLNRFVLIMAGSLLDHEYPLLLDRLGQLAAASHSPMSAPIGGALPGQSVQEGTWISDQALRRANALLDFFNTLQEAWPEITKRPVAKVQRTYVSVAPSSPIANRSVYAVRQIARRPGRDHIDLSVLQESTDSPENQFLALALERLSRQARPLHQSLRRKADYLKQSTSGPPAADREARSLWLQGRHTALQAATYFEQCADKLEKAETWANKIRSGSLLRTVSGRFPSHPSLSITRSPGYGSIYRAYHRVFNSEESESRLDKLQNGLLERMVKPTGELYELWVFLETYNLLVDRFGFQPVDGNPITNLTFHNDEVRFEKGKWFNLSLVLRNVPDSVYTIKIAYEPEISFPPCQIGKRCFLQDVCPSLPCNSVNSKKSAPRTPDVVIKTEYLGISKVFAIDAKYRRYQKQKDPYRNEALLYHVNNTWDLDVLGTAKQKYLDGLDLDAAFVVHSDPEADYNFFGERPHITPAHRESQARFPLYAGHRYGAIYATPSRTANLEKLLRCLLMYHAGWYDICWTCRERLRPKPGTGIVGKYYQCEQGHDFWVKSHCSRSVQHSLIKMGNKSFHELGGEWNCSCPECGDKLSPRPRPGTEMPF